MVPESAQESSALRFVAELGVADAIGDDTKTLSDLAAQVGVGPRFLGEPLPTCPPTRAPDTDPRARAQGSP